jgi:hypothetical protein
MTSATVETPRPATRNDRKKKDRTIRLLALLDTVCGLFSVTEGGKTDRYFFAEYPGTSAAASRSRSGPTPPPTHRPGS